MSKVVVVNDSVHIQHMELMLAGSYFASVFFFAITHFPRNNKLTSSTRCHDELIRGRATKLFVKFKLLLVNIE